jgi:hypothetical protein
MDVLLDRIGEVERWLWEREGKPPRNEIKRMVFGGLQHVLYCDLESTLDDADLSGESLAQFAIESVRKQPKRNGIKYLANNIAQGVITPLTYAYRDAVLRLTGAKSLQAAEEIVLRSAGKDL